MADQLGERVVDAWVGPWVDELVATKASSRAVLMVGPKVGWTAASDS